MFAFDGRLPIVALGMHINDDEKMFGDTSKPDFQLVNVVHYGDTLVRMHLIQAWFQHVGSSHCLTAHLRALLAHARVTHDE